MTHAKRPKYYVHRELGLLFSIREQGGFIRWKMEKTNLSGVARPEEFDKRYRPATEQEIKHPKGYK
jgi:hypothetical protein